MMGLLLGSVSVILSYVTLGLFCEKTKYSPHSGMSAVVFIFALITFGTISALLISMGGGE